MIEYTIEVDREACVGDRMCCEEAPGTFEVDAEGKVVVTNPRGDQPENVLSAAQRCRMKGITLYDADTGARIWPRD